MATRQIDGARSVFLVKADGSGLANASGLIPITIVAATASDTTARVVDGARSMFLVNESGAGLLSGTTIPVGGS